MKIITFKQIKNLGISPLTCYRWVSEALSIKKEALLPPKISLKPDINGVFYNTMPALIPQIKRGGVKVVTRYPERKPSLDSEILLFDLETGENIALIDGNWITAMRTGAVAAHSVKLFAVNNFSQIGMIGLGNTATATLKVLLALYTEQNFIIKLKKYKDQHELFAAKFSNFKNVVFRFCDTYEEVVQNSDVVISAATVFETDICEDKHFKEGVLVVPVHTRGFTNCDLFFDKVYADDLNHVKGFKYFSRYKYFAEVSDVVSSQKPGRENEQERILSYNIGIALHDIYFASKIYELLQNSSSEISLEAPKDKFWV